MPSRHRPIIHASAVLLGSTLTVPTLAQVNADTDKRAPKPPTVPKSDTGKAPGIKIEIGAAGYKRTGKGGKVPSPGGATSGHAPGIK